ncbi:MAG TPA: (5-formylfuran-3-yl)methyl phosphate synthase [Candidatus Methylomirabilis sp.]|nr:(5-formylfuran-3-yl)methyl phosphate synthase [Candidatus Methylomirabilis sp.]
MRLLISVMDAAEAVEAAGAGAHIIDVKDPAMGALGAAAPQSVREVRKTILPELPVSAALGDGPFQADAAAAAASALTDAGADFVKLGLRDTSSDGALALLRHVAAGLPETVHLIAVGFADFHRVRSLHPLELPALAEAAGAHGCLIDTAVKDGRGLLHWLDKAALHSYVAQCRSRRLISALAGSLMPADLPLLAHMGLDILGVRGAACTGADRVRGRVSRERVAALLRALPGR